MDNRLELALYVINLKIADAIKNNKEMNYNIFKNKIADLEEEKKEVYKGNEEIIQKVLNVYLEELKKDGGINGKKR